MSSDLGDFFFWLWDLLLGVMGGIQSVINFLLTGITIPILNITISIGGLLAIGGFTTMLILWVVKG